MTLLLALLLILGATEQRWHAKKIEAEQLRKYALPDLQLPRKFPMFSGLKVRT